MFGPTVGDRVRLADTELIIEVEQDYTLRAGGYGEEVKFGGGKTIRDGMGQSQRVNGPGAAEAVDLVITNALILDHWGIVKADIGIARPAHLRHRQGRQPRRAAGRGHRHRPGHRGHRRRGHDRHRRRHRQPHPLHLPAADRRRAGQRRDHACSAAAPARPPARWPPPARRGRRTSRACCRRPDALPDEPRLPRQGQRQPARGAAPADRGRRHRPEAARGLGHHARRPSTAAWPWPKRPTRRSSIHSDTLNESGFVEDTIAATKGRTLCAFHTEGAGGGHAPDIMQRGRRGQLPALVHQPDDALHGEHGRRAPGHADGVPPPRRQHRRGPGLRRKPHPPRDHRRRGRAARPGRDQHDLQRQPGHGPRRRGGAAHLADGAQDEGAARRAAPATARATTTPAPSATSPSTPSTRRSPTASRTRSAASRSASGPTWCCGSRRSSASSRRWCSRAASSRWPRWATRTPASRRRSRCTTGRCSAASAAPSRAAR